MDQTCGEGDKMQKPQGVKHGVELRGGGRGSGSTKSLVLEASSAGSLADPDVNSNTAASFVNRP